MSRQGGKPKNWYDNYTMDKTLKPALKLLGVTGHGNKPAIAKQLYSNLGNHITAPSAQLVQAKVLATWYLKPFKGSDATRIGIENEKPIFQILPSYLRQASLKECPLIQSVMISQLRDVGLVEFKAHERLASSTDQICIITIAWTNGDADYVGPAVCELKTKATENTIEVYCYDENFVCKLSIELASLI